MTIRYEKTDHIVLITIDRYERRNSFDVDHAEQLMACWDELRDDPDAWVAIVTGVEDCFCSGGDLSAMRDIARETALHGRSESKDRMTRGGKAYFTLKGFDIFKPIIAAVNGHCIAGGMELLGGTDIRIASRDALFSVSEVRRGLFAGGGTTARLPRQIPFPAAMELLLAGGSVSAERALQMGLINEVVPPDALLDTAWSWAETIAANAPIAVQATKKSALLGFRAASLDEAYAIEDECHDWVYNSEDAQEGPTAFFEKRKPVWKGR